MADPKREALKMLTINQTVFVQGQYGTVVAIKLGRTGKQNRITVRMKDGREIKTSPFCVSTQGQFEPALTGQAAYENLREIAGVARRILKNPQGAY
jgi:hypothetical protein